MNILWVRDGRLLPVNAGGRIRSYHTIRELAGRHRVTILNSYQARQPDRDYEADLGEAFPGSRAMWIGWKVPRGVLARTRRQLTLAPVAARDASTREFRRAVHQAIASGEHDVAVCDFVEPAINFPRRLPIPCVLYEHNIEWRRKLDESRYAETAAIRWAYRLDGLRMRLFEARTVRRFDATVAVSEEDARALRALAPRADVIRVGTGVDLDLYRQQPFPAERPGLVVFTGLMGYIPNVDAVRWFCAEIWPRVMEAVPGARFRIVGQRPAPSVRALAGPNVEVTGEVDSVAPHLAEASVVVVPLRAGGGTRLKVFEALAVGRPVISTALGAAGLAVATEHGVVFAEDPVSFAEAVIRLLTHPAEAERLGRQGALFAATQTWSQVGEDFERVLEAVTQVHGS